MLEKSSSPPDIRTDPTTANRHTTEQTSQNAKKPAGCAGFGIMWRRPTLPGVTPVPSALQGLTSLFGMGRGGTPALGRLICKYAVISDQSASNIL